MDHDEVDETGGIKMKLKLQKWSNKLIRTKLQNSNGTRHRQNQSKGDATVLLKGTSDTSLIDQCATEFIAFCAIDVRAAGLFGLRNRVAVNAMAWEVVA
jgi:hypothetical protein